jgi:hypothetical protein
MTEHELRTEALKLLKLTDAAKEEQDIALQKLEVIANDRFGLAIPEMLTEEQLAHLDAMYTAGKDEETIRKWIEGQVPQYKEIMEALILDIAEEVGKP